MRFLLVKFTSQKSWNAYLLDFSLGNIYSTQAYKRLCASVFLCSRVFFHFSNTFWRSSRQRKDGALIIKLAEISLYLLQIQVQLFNRINLRVAKTIFQNLFISRKPYKLLLWTFGETYYTWNLDVLRFFVLALIFLQSLFFSSLTNFLPF